MKLAMDFMIAHITIQSWPSEANDAASELLQHHRTLLQGTTQGIRVLLRAANEIRQYLLNGPVWDVLVRFEALRRKREGEVVGHP
eukprot:CAMPEP_0181172648 /NCGR_PEP_ID=MMETSP1096-20121128/2560_1 /TAXON_ID=156174 ORGANISM="Chrysochromulina ericina, Strain CCMP281" /NCGR_SAMPLE_ID=MMETSP1096 /ASSEMBLY_ACC=CAM_ASM_000453 /LENGTH=84 /DNA_ID=CAMNT_0023260387 /DNA_START=591 /DNA_END=846 /DNA_ORIENTATION=-